MTSSILLKTERNRMDEITTIKVRKSTTTLLKKISERRGRRESQEQVILELIDAYLRATNDK